jgi:hypothetical protein
VKREKGTECEGKRYGVRGKKVRSAVYIHQPTPAILLTHALARHCFLADTMPLQPFDFENKPHSHAFYVFEFSEHSQHAFFSTTTF